ncbi:MAG: exo-alpha-sialidase [Rhodopirellula sp.]|nr:exo-alpha-sialidase [Rhodopirellula sp.]
MKRCNVKRACLTVLVLSVPASAAMAAECFVKDRDGAIPRPIVAVENVCAWPNLTVLGDGSIVATIFNQPSHAGLPGDVECWATEDGGKTWTKRGTAAPHEGNTNRMNVAAGRAGNGDLVVIASGWSEKYPAGYSGPRGKPQVIEPWVCRSADGGRTWSIDKEGFPGKSPEGHPVIPFGDILPGEDGQLRVAIYTVPADRNDRVYIYSSANDGRTWGEPVALDTARNRNETAILHLGDGRWLAAARTIGPDPSGRSMFLDLYGSEDDAGTWHQRMLLTESSQHPAHLVRLKDGRLLLAYGNRTADRGVDVRFSGDEGKSWMEPFRVTDWQGDGGYPSSAQLPDGRVLTAYYAAATEGHKGYHMGVVVWDPEKTTGE